MVWYCSESHYTPNFFICKHNSLLFPNLLENLGIPTDFGLFASLEVLPSIEKRTRARARAFVPARVRARLNTRGRSMQAFFGSPHRGPRAAATTWIIGTAPRLILYPTRRKRGPHAAARASALRRRLYHAARGAASLRGSLRCSCLAVDHRHRSASDLRFLVLAPRCVFRDNRPTVAAGYSVRPGTPRG